MRMGIFLVHFTTPIALAYSKGSAHVICTLVAGIAQERFLADADEKGVAQPEKTYYMPTDADTPVRAFRKWYNTKGDGGPTWAKVREGECGQG